MKPLWSIFRFQPSKATWDLPVFSGAGIGLLLFLGWHFGVLAHAKLAALASLSILYLPASEGLRKQFTVLFLAGIGFIISYVAGMWIAGTGAAKPVWLGSYAALIFGLLQYIRWRRPPGIFFLVMLAAVASFTEPNQSLIGHKIAVMAIGLSLAMVLAILHVAFTYRKAYRQYSVTYRFVPHLHLAEALIFGTIIGLSCQLAVSLQLHSPYWVVVSCLAVMQGSNRGHIWQRSVQRFIGTLAGSLIIYGIILMQPPFAIVIMAIVLSQMTLEYLVSRNYAVAEVFVTILTVFYSVSEMNLTDSGMGQLRYRIIDITAGCVIGAAGGWLIHQYHIKRFISRKLFLIENSLKVDIRK